MKVNMIRAVTVAVPFVLGAAIGLPAQGADKSIVINAEFGAVMSKTTAAPGGPDGRELAQQVRIDQLSSADPDWDGARLTLYEQMESLPDSGTYRIYGVVGTRSGDEAFLQFAGKWDVIKQDGQFVEAPFAAEGRFLGGTGKFKNISGTVSHQGKVTAEGGKYSLKIDASY